MLLKSNRFQAELAAGIDALLVIISLLAALATHKFLDYIDPGDIFATFDMFWSNAWLYVVVLPIWLLALEICGVYRHIFTPAGRDVRTRIATAAVVSLFATLALLYALRISTVPRTILFLHAIYAALAIMVRATWLQPWLLRAEAPRRVLLVAGSAEDARKLAETLTSEAYRCLVAPAGVLSDAELPGDFPVERVGGLAMAADFLHHTPVDVVAILPDSLPPTVAGELFALCQAEGIETWLMPAYLRSALCPPALDEIESMPMILFSTTRKSIWTLALKRLGDVVGSALLLVLLSPLFLLIALLVKCSSKGPVFYTQIRSTRRGRTFPMYKFRTMVPGADKMLDALAGQNESSGPTFKIRNDPRVTPIGRFLRRYSLDELPQLFNVFLGHMSLVGPRPPIPAEVEKYEPWQRRRLSMRSGCTCLWQIGGRNALTFEEWMRLDLQYIDNWSLWLDIKILAKTLSAMIRGTGC